MVIWTRISKYLEKTEKKRFSIRVNSNLKIALVKQTCYADLYSSPYFSNIEESILPLIYSSNHRSGPIGLFLNFNTDFYIVKIEDYPECKVYKEKPSNMKWQNIEKSQEKFGVSAFTVDWAKYDMVIAIENAVPSIVTKKYKNVLWATMLEYHRMSSYKKYRRRLPKGYHVFFDQHFGPSPRTIFKRSHVVEWPYFFNTIRALNTLCDIPKKDIICIDSHQEISEVSKVLAELKYDWFITDRNYSIQEFLDLLVQSKVVIMPIINDNKILWGNLSLEAAAADCIIIGNRKNLWNSCLIDPSLECNDYTQLKKILLKLREDSSFYDICLKLQRERLNYFVYERPFNQIYTYLENKGRYFTIQTKLTKSF